MELQFPTSQDYEVLDISVVKKFKNIFVAKTICSFLISLIPICHRTFCKESMVKKKN